MSGNVEPIRRRSRPTHPTVESEQEFGRFVKKRYKRHRRQVKTSAVPARLRKLLGE